MIPSSKQILVEYADKLNKLTLPILLEKEDIKVWFHVSQWEISHWHRLSNYLILGFCLFFFIKKGIHISSSANLTLWLYVTPPLKLLEKKRSDKPLLNLLTTTKKALLLFIYLQYTSTPVESSMGKNIISFKL